MEIDKGLRNAEKIRFQKKPNPEIEEVSGILKRRRKKVTSKVNLFIPNKPLTAYSIFIKQVSFLPLLSNIRASMLCMQLYFLLSL
jgi:hypothetical protein